jgi:uncharacterized protein (DUF952 family)
MADARPEQPPVIGPVAMTSTDDRIYIFIAADDLELARQTGSYRAASLTVEGFIHASPRSQLERVANKFYSKAAELWLLHVDPARATAEIRWEPATGGLYPHIYGPLNMDAVVKTTVVSRADNGEWVPDEGFC